MIGFTDVYRNLTECLTSLMTSAMMCSSCILKSNNDFLAFSFLPILVPRLYRSLFEAEKAKTTTMILERRGQHRVFFVFYGICYASRLEIRD